jgi:hypothetical protein
VLPDADHEAADDVDGGDDEAGDRIATDELEAPSMAMEAGLGPIARRRARARSVATPFATSPPIASCFPGSVEREVRRHPVIRPAPS